MRLAALLILLLAGAVSARSLSALDANQRPGPPTEDVLNSDPAAWRLHPRTHREVRFAGVGNVVMACPSQREAEGGMC